jgi:hypothetical protein
MMAGVWAFDPAVEHVDLGRFNASPAVSYDATAWQSHGTFRIDDTGVAVAALPVVGDAMQVLSPANQPARLRLQLPAKGRIEVGVWTDVQTGAVGTMGIELMHADGLWLRRNNNRITVQPVHVQNGVARPMTIDTSLRSLPATIEVVMWSQDGWHLADIIDGATMASLATVRWSAPRSKLPGGVAVQWGRSDSGVVLQAMAHRQPSSSSDSTPWHGFGPQRVARGVELERWRAQLPSSLRSLLQTINDQGGWAMITDNIGIETLHRAGIPITVDAEVPYLLADKASRMVLANELVFPPGPLRIDDSYHDAHAVEQVLAELHRRHPRTTRLETIGHSHQGRPLRALTITRDADGAQAKPSVLLDGGHHGGELLSVEMVLDAAITLLEGDGRDRELTRFIDGVDIVCVPMVNPDGTEAYLRISREHDRKNGRDGDGVDLYRNYPVGWGNNGEVGSRSRPSSSRYRGPAAGSEPEVQAMMTLSDRERFVASIDYHTAATVVLVPYTDPSMTEPSPNEAWWVAQRIVDAMPEQLGRRRYRAQKNLYPVDGTAQDAFRHRFGTVALLVELPVSHPYVRADANAVLQANRNSWRTLLRTIVEGPLVAVWAHHADGTPAAATMGFAEHDANAMWSTRARDGRAFRLPLTANATKAELRIITSTGGVVRDVPLRGGTTMIEVVD